MTGKLEVQLARLAGIGRLIAVAGPDNEAKLRRLGATYVINRHDSVEEVTSRVHDILGENEVTHVYDCRNMTLELARSLLSGTKASKLITLHPNEQQDVLAEERPNCLHKFIESIIAGLGADAETLANDKTVISTTFSTTYRTRQAPRVLFCLDMHHAGKTGQLCVAIRVFRLSNFETRRKMKIAKNHRQRKLRRSEPPSGVICDVRKMPQ